MNKNNPLKTPFQLFHAPEQLERSAQNPTTEEKAAAANFIRKNSSRNQEQAAKALASVFKLTVKEAQDLLSEGVKLQAQLGSRLTIALFNALTAPLSNFAGLGPDTQDQQDPVEFAQAVFNHLNSSPHKTEYGEHLLRELELALTSRTN